MSQVGRNTQGVTLIRTAEDESVVGLQRIEEIEEAEVVDGEEESVEGGEATAADTSTPEAKADDAPDVESED